MDSHGLKILKNYLTLFIGKTADSFSNIHVRGVSPLLKKIKKHPPKHGWHMHAFLLKVHHWKWFLDVLSLNIKEN